MANDELIREQQALFDKILEDGKARGDIAALFFKPVEKVTEVPQGKHYENLRTFEDDRDWIPTLEGFNRMENKKRRPYSWMMMG